MKEWARADGTRFAIVSKKWEDLPPRDDPWEYLNNCCDILRVLDACDQWLDCGAVDGEVSAYIETLQHRVEELEETIRGYGHVWWTKDQQVEIDELRAERDRLREALGRIMYEQTRPGVVGEPSLGIARAALRGGEG